jgi:sulfotransferase
MSSALGPLFQRLLAGMGAQTEAAALLADGQREDILKGLFQSFYKRVHSEKLVFDTNRLWCSKINALAQLFPDARVIACVRDLAWIMDSFERITRKNPLLLSKLVKPQKAGTVFTRLEELGSGTGTVGFSWNATQEAFYGENAHRLIVVDYEALTREPARALDFVYSHLGIAPFEHDFSEVGYSKSEFDRWLGVPGLHSVHREVRFAERETILPPDLFRSFCDRNFWKKPGGNPMGVPVLLANTESSADYRGKSPPPSH